MEDLAYDETDHTWTTEEESFEKLVKIMQQECAYPDTASGVYLLATDDHVIFLCGVNSVETDGETRVSAYHKYHDFNCHHYVLFRRLSSIFF